MKNCTLILILVLCSQYFCYAQQRTYYSNLDYRFCSPSSIVEHNGQFLATYISGDVIRFSASDIQPRRVVVPFGRHAQRLFSSHNLLWLTTAAGSLFKSDDAGDRWILHDTAVTAASILADGDLIYASGMNIRRVTSRRDVVDVLQFESSRPGGITGVSMKGDTVVVHQFRDSVLTLHWGSDYKLGSLTSMFDGVQFYSLADSTLTFSEAKAGSLYVQNESLEDGFFNVTAAWKFYNVNSISVGKDADGKAVVLLSGSVFINNMLSSRVVVIGPQYGQAYNHPRVDTASIVGGATLVDDTLVTLHNLGIVSISDSENRQASVSDLKDIDESDGRYGYDLLNPGILCTSHLRRGSETSIVSFIHRNGVSQAVDRDTQGLVLDSIGLIAYMLEYEDGHMVISGSYGIATANRNDGTARVAMLIGNNPMHVMRDGSLIIPLGRGAFLLSMDRGVTWKQHELSPRIPGIYRDADSFRTWYVLNRGGSEIVFIDKDQTGDTLQYTSAKLDPTASYAARIIGTQHQRLVVAQRFIDPTIVPATTTLIFYRYASPTEIDTTVVSVSGHLYTNLSFLIHGDTISLLEKETSRVIRIANGNVVEDSNTTISGIPGYWGMSATRAWFLSADTIVYQSVNEGHWCKVIIGTPFTTSVVDQNIQHFYFQNVHPNPASNKLTVDLGRFVTADVSNVQLFLADMSGETIKQFTKDLPKFTRANEVTTFDLDMSSVPSGAYLLVIRNSQMTGSTKVIVTR